MMACRTAARTTAEAAAWVAEQHKALYSMQANEVLVDHVEPLWMGRRLYYFIKQDAYYAYDHRYGYRYFGRYPNDADARARWRGWLRAGEWM